MDPQPAGTTRVKVNFSKPFPLFPLDGVVLLPHALLRLLLFEPRYLQMADDVLDASGQIALAVFDGNEWRDDYYGSPQLKPSVCIGQIAHHERQPDGNLVVLLQGICRARIDEELASDDEAMYRQAILEPVELSDADDDEMPDLRERLLTRLTEPPLTELRSVRAIEQEITSRHVPTRALIEVVTLSILSDKELQYELLAEGDPRVRCAIIEDELDRVSSILQVARKQVDPDAPKGVVWN